MIAKMVAGRGVGDSGETSAFAEGHGVGALGADQLIDGVEQCLAKLAVMISLFIYCHIQNFIRFILTMSRLSFTI